MNYLLLYKNSTYAFLSDTKRLADLEGLRTTEQINRFRLTHANHFSSLSLVEAALKKRKIKYTKTCRGTLPFDYSRFDMIITVGGDGTFLEAAHHVRHETVWGINSDPVWSVGRFCSGHAGNFEVLLEKILAGGTKITKLNRLKLSFGNGHPPMNVLNDILVCHQNPAAMSRYYLKVSRKKEEQRSSGVWIATAAGSSGGIRSAGGRLLPQESREFLYKPRELYQGKNTDYQLKGDVLKPDQKLAMTSLMRDGVVYVDGSHVRVPFPFGADITVQRSLEPLKVIMG